MAAKQPAKRTRKRYSPVEIQSALTTLAYFGGNTARTATETGIAQQTLHDWRAKEHRDLYLEIAEREAPKLEAIAAQQAREAILRSSDAEHHIFDRLHTPEDLSTKELSELAGAYQRFSTGKGIQVTKLLELTGRPTSIVEHREGNDILRALGAKIPGLIVEATADDVTQIRSLSVSTGSANAREPASQQG
jgi:transposase-like protein